MSNGNGSKTFKWHINQNELTSAIMRVTEEVLSENLTQIIAGMRGALIASGKPEAKFKVNVGLAFVVSEELLELSVSVNAVKDRIKAQTEPQRLATAPDMVDAAHS